MKMKKINNRPCKSCPFVKSGLDLHPEKMAEIMSYLIEGVNHLCHSDYSSETVCRGGRNWQLNIFYRLGVIEQPTDECLAQSMIDVGIAPKSHIK